MNDSSLEIDFASIETHGSVSNEEKEAKILKLLLTFENGLKTLAQTKGKNIQKTTTSGPEAQLLLLLSLPTWNPTPLTQHALCRCIKILYSLARTESIHQFVSKLVDWMQAKEAINPQKRTAVLECINAVVEVQGSKLYPFVSDILALILKCLKTQSESSSTRYNALNLLITILKNANTSLDESTVKELLRICKTFLTNKAGAFKVTGAECYEATVLYCANLPVLYLSEELPILSKHFDDANFSVRRTLASLISTLVAGSQASNGKILLNKPKKLLGSHGTSKTVVDKDAPNALPTMNQMFLTLSTLHNKPHTSEEIRAGVFTSYITLFTKLGTSFVESNYNEILRHILLDLHAGPNYTPESPFDSLIVRQRAGTLLREIGQKILSEQGQVHAAKAILEHLSEWIILSSGTEKQSSATGKMAIITAIDELSFLIQDLGDAAYAFQDSIDPLITVLERQSYSLQISCSWCLRAFCSVLPSFMPRLVSKFISYINKNFLDQMPVQKQVLRRSLGYSYALGSLVSLSAASPQSAMQPLTTQIFAIACQLLKAEANMSFSSGDISVFQSQNAKIQVGWTLLGSVLCLGSNATRLIFPQVTVLFKTYLAKSSLKLSFTDVPAQMLTLSIAHSREHALQALYLLISYNSELLEGDAHQRILPLLANSLQFVKDTTQFVIELRERERESSLNNLRKLTESVNMIRKRTLQCYSRVQPPEIFESSHATLIKTVVELLTVTSRTEKANDAWTDEDIVADWTGWTGSGYAMTSGFHRHNNAIDRWRNERDSSDSTPLFEASSSFDQFDLDQQRLHPRFGAREYDPISIYLVPTRQGQNLQAMTSTVVSTHDAAVDLFSVLFPALLPRSQITTLERMNHAIREAPDNWSHYIISHCLFAILAALKGIFQQNKITEKEQVINNERVVAIIEEIIKAGLVSHDEYIRRLASDTLGYFCKHAGNSVRASQLKNLIDTIVDQNEPDIRAGCLAGLASVYRHIGTAADANNLSSAVQVMRSLCNDMHPLVHIHALDSLAVTISATGHVFAPHIVDTLYVIFRLFLSDSHQPGGGAYAKYAAVDTFIIRQRCGQVLHSIIGVLGPEIASNKASKFLCYGILEQLKHDREEMVVVEYLQCIHLIIMFDYEYIDLEFLVSYLCTRLASVDPQLKRIAANCLYQLVQKNVKDVLKFAGPNLLERLFQLLDHEVDLGEIVVVLHMLLANAPLDHLPPWIKVIQCILSKHNIDNIGSFARSQEEDEEGNLQGDEMAEHSRRHQGNSRWRTQLVALQMLRRVIARLQDSQISGLHHIALLEKFGDLIKLAFAAATTPIETISLEGYGILHDLLIQFNEASDPHQPDIKLLDQFQAQITAALAPAFQGESSPTVTASAIEVGATFLTSNPKQAKASGRIFKLIETALNNCLKQNQDPKTNSFNCYSSISVRLAVLRGWCTIALSLTETESDLLSTLNMNIPKLIPLWVQALCDYAFIRLDPKLVSLTDRGATPNDIRLASGLEAILSSSSRRWVQPFYQEHWPVFLRAITYYIDSNEPTVLQQFKIVDSSTEPSRPFWILFGICLETLASHSLSGNTASSLNLTCTCLNALKSLFRPDITGIHFIDSAVFDEVLTLFERFKYSSHLSTLQALIGTLNSLITNYPESVFYNEVDTNNSSNLLAAPGYRIIKFYVGIILGFVPDAAHFESNIARQPSSNEEDISLLCLAASSIANLVLYAPVSHRPNLAIITVNLLICILFKPSFVFAASNIIEQLEKLFVYIDNDEIVVAIQDKLITKFFSIRQNEYEVASSTLIAFTKLSLASRVEFDENHWKKLQIAIYHSLHSASSTLFLAGIDCLKTLVFSIVSEIEYIRDYARNSLQNLLPTITSEHTSNFGSPKCLEAHVELLLFLNETIKTSFPDLISITLSLLIQASLKEGAKSVSQLTHFVSKYPSAFRELISGLEPQDRTKLEYVIRSQMLDFHATSQTDEKAYNSESKDDYEDYEDFEEYEEELNDTVQPAPTIQLKSTFI